MKVDFYADQGGFDAFIADVREGYDRPEGFAYRVIKRSVDMAGALAGLLLLLPLLPFIVVMIKLETPGPVLFAQTRVGRRGQLFRCYKFRSMSVDAENRKLELAHLNEASGAAFKI